MVAPSGTKTGPERARNGIGDRNPTHDQDHALDRCRRPRRRGARAGARSAIIGRVTAARARKGGAAMDLVGMIGVSAGTLTTIAFLPQVVKAWRTRSTRDVSLNMYLVLFIGIALWLLYGVLRADPPLILANAVTLLLAGAVLVLKLRHG
jgi:MtN3 and saliva related transmembrane protein